MRGMLLGAVIAAFAVGLLRAGETKGDGKPLFNGKDLSGWVFRSAEGLKRKIEALTHALKGAKTPQKKVNYEIELIEATVAYHNAEEKLKGRSKWTVTGGITLDPKLPTRLISAGEGTGVLLNGGDGRGVDLLTDLQHGDCELHVEFNVPRNSNSGVYFQGQYEVQILDSFGKKDKDLKYGDCGGIYNTAPPRTNASKAPGEWQTFDVVFQAPRFDARGKKTADAKFVRVALNGTVIHEKVTVKGPTTAALGGAERPLGPLMLQGDHGPVAFRNLRLKLLKGR